MASEKIKTIKRTLARYGLYSSTWLLTRLPYGFVRVVTHFFIAVGYRLTIRQRRIAWESLNIAFGNTKSDTEKKWIMKKCFENLGKGMIELIYFMAHPEMIKERVFFEGKENLDKAFGLGRGVIGISAHFGNFPLMLLRMAQEGYDTSAIIRPTHDKEIEEYFQRMRTQLGLKTIYSHPRSVCVNTSLKKLRENAFLFIPLDQNFGSGRGVFVDFFGQKAATATGPVVFARRTKAPVIPIFTVRQKDDTHKIIIEEPVELELDNSEEALVRDVGQITKIIERYIRQYPEEWGWMHRRWKSRPKGAGS